MGICMVNTNLSEGRVKKIIWATLKNVDLSLHKDDEKNVIGDKIDIQFNLEKIDISLEKISADETNIVIELFDSLSCSADILAVETYKKIDEKEIVVNGINIKFGNETLLIDIIEINENK